MTTPPVEDDEVLLRQVGEGGNPIYFDPNRKPPVVHALFLPTTADTDGLSMIRKKWRTEVWAAYRKERPQMRFRLAPVEVKQLREYARQAKIASFKIGSTPDVLDEEFGPPYAHCVLVSINRTDYETDPAAKRKIKEWARLVANGLQPLHILGPYEAPSSSDPYRPPTS